MLESNEKNSPTQLDDDFSSQLFRHASRGFIGGTVAILVYFGIFWSLGMRMPPVFLIGDFVIGAIFGMLFAAIFGMVFTELGIRNRKSHFLIFLITTFAGIAAPLCFIQLLFLISLVW